MTPHEARPSPSGEWALETTDLLPDRDLLRLHNETHVADGDVFVTTPARWGYAVSFEALLPRPSGSGLEPVVLIDVEVIEGSIGVGALAAGRDAFVAPEVDVVASRPVTVALRPSPGNAAVHVMMRNTASGGASSRFRLHGARLRFATGDDRLLVPRTCPEIKQIAHGAPPIAGTFDLFVSHSSRRWDAAQCERRYLEARYARPDRLDNLPDFASLPPNQAPYEGSLSVFRITLTADGVAGTMTAHYTSPERLVHACRVRDDVLVCLDAGLAVFQGRSDDSGLTVVPDDPVRIEDPWFGGLHTVVPGGDGLCLVSSSGADAILWLDLGRKTVVRRWRLPASRYGSNYALDTSTWLRDHYVPNDLQLGHLNCASPDGSGGAYFSVLGQGDIGHVDADGRFDLLLDGYVGCHGVRYAPEENLLYFSDSCRGRVIRVDARGRATTLFDAGSRWLHDAVYLGHGLFALALGDANRLVLADAGAGRRLSEWDVSAVGGSIQFLSLARTRSR